MDIERYRYLWDGSQPDWVLVRDPSPPGGIDNLEIFNLSTYMMFVVEDDKLSKALTARMRKEGVRVIDSIPPGGPYG